MIPLQSLSTSKDKHKLCTPSDGVSGKIPAPMPPHLCCIRSTGGRTQNVIQQVWPASDPATYPLWFTPDIHQKKSTRLKTSYLFKDPVTKDKTKVICIFRVQISWRTHFTSKYVCFPSHRESLVVTTGVRQGSCPLNLQKRKICWRPFETT